MGAATKFGDQLDDFRVQQEQLERRRALAQQLIAKGMEGNTGSGYQGGRVYIVGNPLGNIASSVAGNIFANQNDQQQQQLEQAQQQAQSDWSDRFAKAPATLEQSGPMPDGSSMPDLPGKTKQQLLAEARDRGLKYDLEQAFLKAGEDRDFRAEQATQAQLARAQEKADQREWQAVQDAKYKRTLEEAMKLKQTPTIHISNSGGGAAANPFAGAATQAGIDPRDEMPVYRVSKTGELFKYGENGPVAHTGAVAPKPAAVKEPTESERSSAGYLGRMEAAEKNLTGAQPLPYAQQRGLEKAPGLTNYTLNAKQQVTRQQQEDWVRAKLRKESGAVIGDEEMAREIRTYFPQAGDGPEVIKQKAQSRAQALEQMRSSAGRSKPTQAAPVGAPVRVTNDADYAKVPSGAIYIAPDGKTRRKP